MSKTVFAIQERAVSENTDAGPQGKGWQEDIAYTLEARNKVQAVCGAASGSVAVPANDNAPQLPLRFLSVCSGIEAASVAWHPLGWRAVAFSEIEKFPSAVLAHHYPDVPNLGDFTKIDTKTLGKVDILAGGTPCFTAGHMVLTEKGYAPIESIKVGDKVVTHKGRLRTVVRIGNEVKEVGVMSGVGMCEPITCTPDHPFLAVEWRNQNTKRNNEYAKVEHCGHPDWTAATDMPGNQWCQLTAHDNDNRAPESSKFDSKTAMYVAGMYLGDGWIRKHDGKNKKSVMIGINPAKYKKLHVVLGNAVHTVANERTTVRVAIHDTVFAEWLEREFGHYSHLKTVPAWVMGHDFRAEFLRGFLDADGNIGKSGKVSISTTSRSLAYGISDLLAAEGYVSSVAFVATPETCVIEGRTCNQKDYYQVRAYPLSISRKARVRHGMVLRAVSGFAPAGQEMVFNIEVEDDHSYVVQGAIVHNCQAFSVAGLRKGLDDARGNLTLKFVELAHELADGNGLRNVVWENVVGVLSDKGNAFGCFLAGLVGADSAIQPPSRGKWPTHGMVSGPKGRAAWAVKDAQYFGVAQRRRRVLVVADFGNGADPAAVLFEPESVCRNSPPSREAGKGVAANVAPSIGGRSHWDGEFPHPTLSQSLRSSGGIGSSNQEVFSQRGSGLVHHAVLRGHSDYGDGSPTLRAKGGDCAGGSEALVFAPEIARCVATREGSSQDYETTTMVAVGVTGQTTHALTAEGADASEDGTGRGTPVIAFQSKASASQSMNPGDISPTLDKGKGDGIAVTVAIRGRDGGATAELGGDVATALRASQGGGDKPHVLAFAQNSRDEVRLQGGDGQICGALAAEPGMKQTTYLVTSAVRRLTPRECERLQGFQWLCSPDYPGAWQDESGRWWTPDYTDIPWRGKPTSPDGPRYKALGNSWAVPKFVWLGKRITAHMPQIAAQQDMKAAA